MAKRRKTGVFFIVFHMKDGETTGHSIVTDPETIHKPRLAEPKADAVKTESKRPTEFEAVLQEFVTSVESFRKFIPMTFEMAPFVLRAMGERKLNQFARSKGMVRADLSKDDVQVFELNAECFRELRLITDELDAAFQGTKILPELGIIGLVSAYDAFLANLLKTVLRRHEEIFLRHRSRCCFQSC